MSCMYCKHEGYHSASVKAPTRGMQADEKLASAPKVLVLHHCSIELESVFCALVLSGCGWVSSPREIRV